MQDGGLETHQRTEQHTGSGYISQAAPGWGRRVKGAVGRSQKLSEGEGSSPEESSLRTEGGSKPGIVGHVYDLSIQQA